jgi:hypothetical protein
MATNIFAGYLQPPKSVLEHSADLDRRDLLQLQLEGQRGQNQLLQVTRQGQMQQAQQQIAERNALQRLAQQYGGDEERFERELMSSGMPGLMSQAEAISKRRLDRKKTDSEIKEREAKTEKEKHALAETKRKEAVQHIGAFSSPQEAMASLERAADIPPEQKQAILQSLQATGGDPLKFREWQLRLVLSLANPEQQAKAMAPNIQTRNTGATTDTLAVDPITGVGRVTGSVVNTQSPDSVASNARMAADAAAGRAVTIRGQDLTDARQRDLNETTKSDKAAAKKEETVNKAVTKFSDTLQKEGIPELETAISAAEGAIGRYKEGDVPGVGRLTGAVPSALLSEEGNDVRQAVASVRNIVLNARSGAAVTDQELRRLVEELGTGIGQSESALRRGLQKVRDRMDVIKANATAGVSDDVLNTYTERGGLKLQRGVPEKKKPEVKDASAFSDAEKEARYQAWKAKQK